jgi:cytochrome c-type biogenesis protein CcmH
VKRKLLAGAILAILISLIPTSVMADDVQMSPKALEIANNLNCPVCEGQPVRDSNSQLARDMRRTIQERLDEGYTEEEVYDYFVDRYGVGILREPPRSGFFLTLWWAPVIGIAIGALVLGTFITQRKKSGKGPAEQTVEVDSTSTDDDDLSEYENRILQDLEDNDSHQGRR